MHSHSPIVCSATNGRAASPPSPPPQLPPPPPPPPPPTIRPYIHVRDHAAVRHICRNVYGGTDDLPERVSRVQGQPGTHILAAAVATGSCGGEPAAVAASGNGEPADAELDALVCCQERGDVLWLYGLRTREERRGNGLAQALLEEAERLARSLPGCAALLSVTIPANDTMCRLFSRSGFGAVGSVRIWPGLPAAREAHVRLQQEEAEGQGHRSLLQVLPAAATAADSAAARQLLPRWRRCQSADELLSLLLLLRERRRQQAGAAQPAAEAAAAAAEPTPWQLPATSNVFAWLPAEFELVPAGSSKVAELIQQGQVWLLTPPAAPAAPAAPGGAPASQQQQQQAPGELDAAVLLLWGAGFRSVRHAGAVAGSAPALASALLHASGGADPMCCSFYIDACDRFNLENLLGAPDGSTGSPTSFLPFCKPLL